jgi:hypothetical protein
MMIAVDSLNSSCLSPSLLLLLLFLLISLSFHALDNIAVVVAASLLNVYDSVIVFVYTTSLAFIMLMNYIRKHNFMFAVINEC